MACRVSSVDAANYDDSVIPCPRLLVALLSKKNVQVSDGGLNKCRSESSESLLPESGGGGAGCHTLVRPALGKGRRLRSSKSSSKIPGKPDT